MEAHEDLTHIRQSSEGNGIQQELSVRRTEATCGFLVCNMEPTSLGGRSPKKGNSEQRAVKSRLASGPETVGHKKGHSSKDSNSS